VIAAYAQLASAMILVGANVPVGKLLAAELPVPVILFLRCLLACLVLAPLGLLTPLGPIARPSRAAGLNLALQALFGTLLYNVALLAGLRRTGALEAGLVLATLPAIVAVGAALFLHERLTLRSSLAVLLAVGGMAMLASTRPTAPGTLAGDALVLVGVCGEAAYVLLAKRNSGRLGVVAATFWMQVASVAFLALFAIPALPDAVFTWRLIGLLAFHGLTASVLAVLLWYGGLRRVPAATAGVFAGLLPLTAGALAIELLGETPDAPQAIGAALLLASIAAGTSRQGRCP